MYLTFYETQIHFFEKLFTAQTIIWTTRMEFSHKNTIVVIDRLAKS